MTKAANLRISGKGKILDFRLGILELQGLRLSKKIANGF
jgi:hypothetical protein